MKGGSVAAAAGELWAGKLWAVLSFWELVAWQQSRARLSHANRGRCACWMLVNENHCELGNENKLVRVQHGAGELGQPGLFNELHTLS